MGATMSAARVDCLEPRRLLAAPHVTSIIPDNRGEVLITLDQPVVASTVSGRSVQMHTAGADGVFAYANGGIWDGTIIHRSAHLGDNSAFVIQGGGFGVDANNTVVSLPHNAAVPNEPTVSNTRGTIAMAKLGSPTAEFPDPVNS